MRYEFLEFALDTEQQSLSHSAGTVPLRRQSFLVLAYLVEHAPAVVGKDELLDAIWGHQAISSSAVAQTIRELREALGDHADHPRAIETRHRVGYRFIAEVRTADDDNLPARASNDPPFVGSVARSPAKTRVGRKPAVVTIGAVLALLLLSLAIFWQRSASTDLSPNWPENPRARDLAQKALVATRHFSIDEALGAIGQARAIEDQPRLVLWQARLHLLRGERLQVTQELAGLESRRANLRRVDQLMLDAIQHEVAGRFGPALEDWRIAYEMDPADVDVGLALYSAQVHEASPELRTTYERITQLDNVPPPRRLLMSAQLADREHDVDRQATQAQAAEIASAANWPVMAALAQVEMARALKARGQIGESRGKFTEAIKTLELNNILRPAIEARLDQLDPALVQGDMETVVRELDAVQARVLKAGDNYAIGRLLHARGRLARRLGDNELAVSFYTAAAEQHESAHNTDGVASALSAKSGPLQRLGRTSEAREVLDQALRLAEQSGTASIRANVHGNIANLAAMEARYADARKNYDASLVLFRELHDQRMEAVTLGHLANLSVHEGDLREAERLNREALELFRTLQQPPDIARILISLAAAALDNGNLAEASKLSEESAAIFERINDPNRLANALALGADIRIHAADLSGAETLLAAAAAAGDLDAEKQSIVATLHGRIAMLRSQPKVARAAFSIALAKRDATELRAFQRASRLDLASVDLAQGQLAAAEQATIAVAVQGREDDEPSSERDARLLLARILLEQDRRSDAERELVAARSLLDGAPNFDGEATWALLRSRLDSNPERTQRLQWLVEHAQEHGQRLLELRATGLLYVETDDPKVKQWRDQVRSLGLLSLLRPMLVLGS